MPTLAFAKGWTGAAMVERVVVVTNGGVNVRLSDGITGCKPLAGYPSNYGSIYPDHAGIDRIYSMLLSAQVSKLKVQVYIATDDQSCKITEVVLGGEYNK